MPKLLRLSAAIAAFALSIASVGAVHFRISAHVEQRQPAVMTAAVVSAPAPAPAPSPGPAAAPAMARCPPCNCKGIKARIPSQIFAKHACPPCPCVGDLYYPEHDLTNERIRIDRNLAEVPGLLWDAKVKNAQAMAAWSEYQAKLQRTNTPGNDKVEMVKQRHIAEMHKAVDATVDQFVDGQMAVIRATMYGGTGVGPVAPTVDPLMQAMDAADVVTAAAPMAAAVGGMPGAAGVGGVAGAVPPAAPLNVNAPATGGPNLMPLAAGAPGAAPAGAPVAAPMAAR